VTRVVATVAALVVLAGVAKAGAPPPPVTVDGFPGVGNLRFADVDGDGVRELLLSSGREVRVFRGTRDGGVAAAAAWTQTFESASLVWPAGSLEKPDGAPRWKTAGAPGGVPSSGLILAEWVRGEHEFEPDSGGYEWRQGAEAISLGGMLRRKVIPAGPFLADKTVQQTEWPDPYLVPAWSGDGGKPAALFLGDASIRAFTRGGREVSWATDFLPPVRDGRALLVDLDADGAPDLAHEQATNDSGTYTFFRVAPPTAESLAGAKPGATVSAPDLRPARGQIRLSGYQIPSDYVDLDGDGRKDLVVTTIDIDAKNVAAAVMKGRVTARTRAFLNRSASGETFFQGVPDAEVESSILVKVQFTYSGSIDVKRSYTILATGDLDGDGRKDLVIRSGPETLSVRRGVAKGVWSTEPYEVAIPPIGDSPDVEGHAADLTGDGRDDLVLLYRAGPGGADRTVVVVSP
jgi:hypothetical protein